MHTSDSAGNISSYLASHTVNYSSILTIKGFSGVFSLTLDESCSSTLVEAHYNASMTVPDWWGPIGWSISIASWLSDSEMASSPTTPGWSTTESIHWKVSAVQLVFIVCVPSLNVDDNIFLDIRLCTKASGKPCSISTTSLWRVCSFTSNLLIVSNSLSQPLHKITLRWWYDHSILQLLQVKLRVKLL